MMMRIISFETNAAKAIIGRDLLPQFISENSISMMLFRGKIVKLTGNFEGFMLIQKFKGQFVISYHKKSNLTDCLTEQTHAVNMETTLSKIISLAKK